MALSEKSLESMLKAVDIIATKRADDKAYDSTVICTIVDNSDKKNGCYIVTDGAVKFKAYSEVTTYRVDEQVRVTIPNGDYTQTKYIEGKYVVDNSMSPITYVSALDGVVKIGDLTSDLTNSEGGLIASGSIKEILIGYIDLSNKSKDLQENSIYDTLFLQADFKSLLNNSKVSAGSYGLRLDCQIRTEKEFSYITKSLYLDSSEMFGDPYSFVLFSTQSKKFSLKDFGIINKITIYFYQNFQGIGEINTIKNLFVKNIQCGFGIDVTTIPDNTVQIYSSDSKSFAAADETNIKEINLLWYNKNKDNQYLGFSDGIIDSTYDEIDYLDQVEFNKKLLAQKGKPNIPTDKNGLIISANSEEAFSILEESQSLIKKDLKNTLVAFRDRLDGQAIDLFDKEDDNWWSAGILYQLNYLVDKILYESTKELKEYLEANLAYAADLQKFQQGQLTELSKNQLECSYYYDNIDGVFYDLCGEESIVKAFLEECRQEISTSFYGVYDTYQTRIEKIIGQLNLNWQNLDKLLIPNVDDKSYYLEDLVTMYKKDTEIIEYSEEPSKYDNYYCIYWYRYIEDFYDPNERFMDRGWQRFTPEYEFNISSKEFGTLPPNAKSLTIFLDFNKAEEKFAVVLFYNHEMYKSNELVFTNDNFKNPNNIDKVKALSIKHGNNSFDNYQTFYSSSNFLRNNRDALISRELQLNYDGIEEGNEALIGASVYWYVPKHTTMIDVDNLKLEKLNFSNDSAPNEIKSSYYRDGYICFYKKIESEEDTYFYYRLKNYYSPTFLKNTIFCLIEKQEDPFETDITFNFGTLGSNGTDYTLVVVPATRQTAVEKIYDEIGASIGEKNLSLSIGLYDYNNNPIDIYYDDGNENVKIEWIGPTTYNGSLVTESLTDTEPLTKKVIGIEISPKTDIEDRYGILKITVTFNIGEDGKQRIIDLSALYPIAWSAGAWSEENQYSRAFYIEGATTVVYDSYGINPNYYKDPYKIFWNDTNNEITSVTWGIVSSKEDMSVLDENYMPSINNNYQLIPSNLYLDGIDWYPVVQCYNRNGNIIWSQPIVIMQNRYPSPMLNAWDGSFTIDEDKGTILSTMIGAGRKTTDNTFEGILMGNVSGGAGIKTGIGLYGFKDGAQSFGLNIDGTAFFGKAGRGRIEFDGNSGVIKSAGWNDECTSGMKIDLDDGIIDIRGATDNGFDQIKLNASGEEEKPYFLIKSDDKEILHIGKNNYFLQSKNYSAGEYSTTDGTLNKPGTGTKIDLKNGRLDAYNLKITSKNIYMDSTENANPYFVIKDNHGHNLFYTGTNEYYLKTCNYKARKADKNGTTTTYGTGIKIDLQNNKIDAYDFMIRGESSSETTGGSYILLDSTTPQFVMHLKKPGTNPLVDLDLVRVSASEFMLHSANWNVTTNINTTTITTATCAKNYNIRSGPGTNYSIVGTTGSSSKTVTIYEQSEGTGSEMWYRIGEDEWVANGAISNIQTSSGGEQVSGSGMEINMNNGCITAYNNNNAGKNLIINAGASKYPIQLGTINDYNLKLGWDGSLRGGTTYTWSISSSGKATFNSMIVNSGTIGGCTISNNKIEGKKWTLNSDGKASFTGINIDGYALNVVSGVQLGGTAKVASQQPNGVYSGYSVMTNTVTSALKRDTCYVIVNGIRYDVLSDGSKPITALPVYTTCYIWNGSTSYNIVAAKSSTT